MADFFYTDNILMIYFVELKQQAQNKCGKYRITKHFRPSRCQRPDAVLHVTNFVIHFVYYFESSLSMLFIHAAFLPGVTFVLHLILTFELNCEIGIATSSVRKA